MAEFTLRSNFLGSAIISPRFSLSRNSLVSCRFSNKARFSMISETRFALQLPRVQNSTDGLLGKNSKFRWTCAAEKYSSLEKAESIAAKFLPLASIVTAAAFCATLDPSLVAIAADAPTTCSDALASDTNPNAVYLIFCIAEFIALTGAAVGGNLARRRKEELEIINTQLRQINISLRKQAKVESYAPGLSYAPVGSKRVKEIGNVLEATVDTKDGIVGLLKLGKRSLRQGDMVTAAKEFEHAYVEAGKAEDYVSQKKAARGLGASYQRQQKFEEAVTHHKKVLEISQVSGESSGETEAYGAIADCYVALGNLEEAAKYYDKYIGRLEQSEE